MKTRLLIIITIFTTSVIVLYDISTESYPVCDSKDESTNGRCMLNPEQYCMDWCDVQELYDLGCTLPILDFITRASNLFDDEFDDGVYYRNFIGLPDGMSKEKFEWCLDFIHEKRISNSSESLNKKWGKLYLEYQILKELFSDYPNNMTTIERMAEIDDEAMRIATILSEREFTIDVPEMNNRNTTFADPDYSVSDLDIDPKPEFEVQREIAKQIYKSLPKDEDSPYLGIILGDDRTSIQFGIDITKLTPEKNKEYYEKLFEEKFSGVIVYNVVFKERQGGDE